MSESMNRRSFIKTTSSLASASVLGLPLLAARGANEAIHVGLIGTGGRCRRLMQTLADIPNVRMTALCDIYDTHLGLAKKIADPKSTTTKRYQDILESKDIDAVLIGSPDHWHAKMTIDALEAGKDVYVEKPLTHDISEGDAILKAMAKHKQVAQVGTQQRSMTHLIKAKELIDAGRLGRVFKARLTWNRNTDRIRRYKLNIDPKTVDWKAFLGSARQQSFDAYRFCNWRWFWDFGGGIFTDLMVHWIDVVHWMLNIDQPPERAMSIGQHTVSKGIWETPDTVQTLLAYSNNIQAHFAGTFSNARDAAMLELMGTKATLYVDRGRYELHPERNQGKYEEMVLGKGPRGKDFYENPNGEKLHLLNWLDCIRTRKTPTAPLNAGVVAAAAAHLANQSLRSGNVAKRDKD